MVFEKKGIHYVSVRFKSNLIEVPFHTWCINSGSTTHVSNTMQGFHTTQTINANEKFILMENRVKAPVEVIGTYGLILDT